MSRKQAGFSLIEVTLWLLVAGLLAGVAVPNISRGVRAARTSGLAETIATLQEACDLFFLVNGRYPVDGQHASCPEGRELDLDAQGLDGRSFYPGYIRTRPVRIAQRAGLNPGFGDAVYYGISRGGKVFATQVPPDSGGAWGDGMTPVYTQESLPRFVTLAEVCPRPGGLTGPRIMEFSADRLEVPAGGSITVTGSVVDASGAGVEGVAVVISIKGSAGYSWEYNLTTGEGGRFSQEISSEVPQYLLVTAAVLEVL